MKEIDAEIYSIIYIPQTTIHILVVIFPTILESTAVEILWIKNPRWGQKSEVCK